MDSRRPQRASALPKVALLRRVDRYRESRIIGLQRTRLQWARTGAIDPHETFIAEKKHWHLVTIGRFSGARLVANLSGRAAPSRASASSPLSHSSVSLSRTRSILSATPSSGAVRFLLWFVDNSQSFSRRSGTIEERFSHSFWVAQR